MTDDAAPEWDHFDGSVSSLEKLAGPRLVLTEERAAAVRRGRAKAQADAAAYLAEHGEEAPWSAREALPPETGPAPSLPADLLPESLRPWLADVADRTSLPLEMVAAPALVALGSVIGRAVAIRPMARNDWEVPANLWGAVVAPPGYLKSAAVSEALRPLRRLEAAARKAFEDAQADHEVEQEGREAKRKAIRSKLDKAAKGGRDEEMTRLKADMKAIASDEARAESTERRFTTSDSTTEKLGMLLNENPRGLLVSRDELTDWLRAMDREDRAQDRAFYLEAWNGTNPFTVDRVGRGTLHVDALCLSVIGGIQPGRLGPYIAGAIDGGEDADGLLQRLQVLVWPDELGEWRAVDRWPDHGARDEAFGVFERLANMAPEDIGAREDVHGLPFLRFDADGQALFLEWRHELERRLRSSELQMTPAFCSAIAKYRSLQPKLALVLHMADLVAGKAEAGAVGIDAARRAAALTEFLEAHARKVYSPELDGALAGAHALGRKILAGAITDLMPIRLVAERDWSKLRRAGDVNAAAEVLEAAGWLRIENVDTGGRPSTILRLHPDFRRAAA